jgi:molybdenum cofactor synthesis domain-containing protein
VKRVGKHKRSQGNKSRRQFYNRLMLLAVLTISDRCSQGLMTDTAGPAVAAALKAAWPQAEVETRLLPDDEEQIAAALLELCKLGAALALTVGGTGLGPRDRTPEATRRVIDREAPGLAEAMRAKSAAGNPYAWLSRGVAGLKGSTLIVNVPGSERGAVECWAAIAPLVRHGLEVIQGGQTHP